MINNGYALSGEAVYGKQLKKAEVRIGLQYQHNFARNESRKCSQEPPRRGNKLIVQGNALGIKWCIGKKRPERAKAIKS